MALIYHAIGSILTEHDLDWAVQVFAEHMLRDNRWHMIDLFHVFPPLAVTAAPQALPTTHRSVNWELDVKTAIKQIRTWHRS